MPLILSAAFYFALSLRGCIWLLLALRVWSKRKKMWLLFTFCCHVSQRAALWEKEKKKGVAPMLIGGDFRHTLCAHVHLRLGYTEHSSRGLSSVVSLIRSFLTSRHIHEHVLYGQQLKRMHFYLKYR